MRGFIWIVLLLLACCAGCEKVEYRDKPVEFVSCYHIKVIVNGELSTEWYSAGPVWKDDNWQCVFVDKATKCLIRLNSVVPKKDMFDQPVSVVVVTGMDKADPDDPDDSGPWMTNGKEYYR